MSDPYAGAKANLRDNVKWMGTAFAGVAAVILAGTPFASFGALKFGDPLYNVALGSLAVAAILLFTGWWQLFKLLRADTVFRTSLRKDFETSRLDADEAKEIEAVRDEFRKRKLDLLPSGLDTFDDLEKEVDRLWKVAGDSKTPENEARMARESYAGYRGNITMVLGYASYYRFQYRVDHAIKFVMLLGIVSLAAMVVFVTTVSASKERDGKEKPTIIVQPCAPCPPIAPAAPPAPAVKDTKKEGAGAPR